VILTTSKPDYAFDAFQYHVDDYLKKPFTYKRFLESIEKIQKIRKEEAASSGGGRESDHMFIKVDNKLVRLENSDILFIESMGDYVRFVTPAKKHVTLNTLKNLEEKLSRQQFLKVHRSYIVNITKIDDLQGNTIYIQGSEIPIGKGHREEVLKRLNIL
jgi:DNA-binding LytR/AlgR family response regulator